MNYAEFEKLVVSKRNNRLDVWGVIETVEDKLTHISGVGKVVTSYSVGGGISFPAQGKSFSHLPFEKASLAGFKKLLKRPFQIDRTPLAKGCHFDCARGRYIGEAVQELAMERGWAGKYADADHDQYADAVEEAEDFLQSLCPKKCWAGFNENGDWGVWDD